MHSTCNTHACKHKNGANNRKKHFFYTFLLFI